MSLERSGWVAPAVTSGQRIAWDAVPRVVRAEIEKLLGNVIVGAESQPGGFSEGVAARLHLADAGSVFVKAASTQDAPSAAGFHRREIAIARHLPASAPVSKLIDVYDDGTWVALLFEDIDGRLPEQPWRQDEFDLALATIARLATTMTPTPIPDLTGTARLGGWQELISTGNANELAELSPWAYQHLDDLIRLEEQRRHAITGDTLLHGDLYPFNLLIAAGKAYVIDWAHAWVGAPHCDLLTLLSSASLSGIDPQPYLDTHPLTRGIDPLRIDVFLALHAGFLLHRAMSLPPAVDRGLRSMMTALGLASLEWLQRRI